MARLVLKKSKAPSSSTRHWNRSPNLGLIALVSILLFTHYGQSNIGSYTSLLNSMEESSYLLAQSATNTATKQTSSFLHGHDKHDGSSDDFDFLMCVKDVLDNLPIGKGRLAARRNPKRLNIVFAHHFDANNGPKKWNAKDRFQPMPQLQKADAGSAKSCVVWEVGAHERAEDSRTLLEQYPDCTYHAFEPIPTFFDNLQRNWKDEPRMHTHNFGIGVKDDVFQVDPNSLHSQSTYIGDYATDRGDDGDVNYNHNNQGGGAGLHAHIKSFEHTVAEAGGQYPTLMHMNCEGCEWELLPSGMDVGFIQRIPIIQIGFHNYGEKEGLGGRAWQLCEIRQRLSQSHRMVKGVPFAWERWIKK
ncbi:expressed unknown protein [Seminavis robusta]|uniref:Methyltransferase FkbM domain-containing protein n=1 Tax=Seminavis robusta TaxID=568900 RepID=A0A9N8H434_9STRA|nr:expressed unknown protein [Seminavis robusta]|eukprot:Sro103_g052520.1 n/a (359) ;mRNA; f:71834-72910